MKNKIIAFVGLIVITLCAFTIECQRPAMAHGVHSVVNSEGEEMIEWFQAIGCVHMTTITEEKQEYRCRVFCIAKHDGAPIFHLIYDEIGAKCTDLYKDKDD